MSTLIDSYTGSFNDSEPCNSNGGYSPIGQSFTGNGILSTVAFYGSIDGSPSGGNYYAKLYSHSGTYGSTGVPDTLLATSDARDILTAPPSSNDWWTFTFSSSNQYTMTNGTHYFIQLFGTTNNGAGFGMCGQLGGGTGATGNGYYNGAYTSEDFLFEVYANVPVVYTLSATVGSFTLLGININLSHVRTATLAYGSYVLTGFNAILSKTHQYLMSTTVGSFVITGFNAAFTKAMKMTVAVGTYTLTGFNIGLSKVKTMTVAVGSYVVTGFNVNFTRAIRATLQTGYYILRGFDLNGGYQKIFYNSRRDENRITTLIGAYSGDGINSRYIKTNPTSHALQISDGNTGTDYSVVNAIRDENRITVMQAVSSVDGITPVELYSDINFNLLVKSN